MSGAKADSYLIAAGMISALISILHVILAVRPDLFKYISPDQESGLGQLAAQGSSLISIATAGLALIFAFWALYAFSGAGLIRRLPLLRAALIIIGGIYIFRALFLPSEINMVLTAAYPLRFVFFSAVSLVAGLLYLVGGFRVRRSLIPGK